MKSKSNYLAEYNSFLHGMGLAQAIREAKTLNAWNLFYLNEMLEHEGFKNCEKLSTNQKINLLKLKFNSEKENNK